MCNLLILVKTSPIHRALRYTVLKPFPQTSLVNRLLTEQWLYSDLIYFKHTHSRRPVLGVYHPYPVHQELGSVSSLPYCFSAVTDRFVMRDFSLFTFTFRWLFWSDLHLLKYNDQLLGGSSLGNVHILRQQRGGGGGLLMLKLLLFWQCVLCTV